MTIRRIETKGRTSSEWTTKRRSRDKSPLLPSTLRTQTKRRRSIENLRRAWVAECLCKSHAIGAVGGCKSPAPRRPLQLTRSRSNFRKHSGDCRAPIRTGDTRTGRLPATPGMVVDRGQKAADAGGRWPTGQIGGGAESRSGRRPSERPAAPRPPPSSVLRGNRPNGKRTKKRSCDLKRITRMKTRDECGHFCRLAEFTSLRKVRICIISMGGGETGPQLEAAQGRRRSARLQEARESRAAPSAAGRPPIRRLTRRDANLQMGGRLLQGCPSCPPL